ncbi:restriction endonuclease subunit S [Myroides odoratimimus]|uniref:restriction endonuclease subunit S n=1 Tax=Myroides odoratimimus TaxID=76832 RepID=UPI0010399920|nr:restriction endonuclease subunit S [Myroides odoratimimus]QBK77383.1 restriction endonuclease subunit S [Myroides odoratimimus]WHT72817.1 restriction endonuclease subunit S [Myroides odoratimimus]WHU37401.1 restriction endonuclease subunit S [Myroides odoratimimus]
MENLQPKLRFPEFREEWIEKTIGKVIKFRNGKGHEKVIDSNGDFIVVNSKYISTDGFVSKYTNELISPLFKNDIVMVMSDLPNGKALAKCLLIEQDNLYTLNQRICALTPNPLQNNPFFLKHIISRNSYFLKLDDGVNQTNLKKNEVLNCPLTIPTLQEQTKIADFLGAVDKQLDILNQKKEKLNLYKKGVMQQLFSQQIRFKDDNGNDFPDWQEKTLGEVLKYTQPNKFIVKSTDYNNLYNIPVLTAGKSFLLGYTNETDNIYKNIPCIIFDDFTTSSQFVDFEFKIKSSAMKILNTIGNDNIKFLFELINTIHFPTGDEHKRYWISEYSKLKLSIPTIEEQTKIANFLSAIDNQIEAVENQITKTETYKKGLLQQMFV